MLRCVGRGGRGYGCGTAVSLVSLFFLRVYAAVPQNEIFCSAKDRSGRFYVSRDFAVYCTFTSIAGLPEEVANKIIIPRATVRDLKPSPPPLCHPA